MLLYKYLPIDRKSVLENGLIRFTQPSCFNDPFEALPNVEQFLSGELVSVLFKYLLNDELFNALVENIRNKNKINSLRELRNSLLSKNSDELNTFFKRLTIGDASENPTESMKEFWNNQVGILSLSEEDDNLTMWSHYSNKHEGFIIGFNPEKNITDNKKCMIKLRKVSYSCLRPSLILFEFGKDKKTMHRQWINDFLFTKSIHWSYENEWRQVNYLKTADFKPEKEEDDNYLFKYNRDSIEEMIFGCNIKPENKKEIMEIVKDWNIAIFEMKTNIKQYYLDKIRIK